MGGESVWATENRRSPTKQCVGTSVRFPCTTAAGGGARGGAASRPVVGEWALTELGFAEQLGHIGLPRSPPWWNGPYPGGAF